MRSLMAARVVYSTLFFVMASALLVLARPRALFDESTGEPKPFGSGPDRTLFSLGLVVCLLAVVAFFGFSLIDMVYACSVPRWPERRAMFAGSVAPRMEFPHVPPGLP